MRATLARFINQSRCRYSCSRASRLMQSHSRPSSASLNRGWRGRYDSFGVVDDGGRSGSRIDAFTDGQGVRHWHAAVTVCGRRRIGRRRRIQGILVCHVYGLRNGKCCIHAARKGDNDGLHESDSGSVLARSNVQDAMKRAEPDTSCLKLPEKWPSGSCKLC